MYATWRSLVWLLVGALAGLSLLAGWLMLLREPEEVAAPAGEQRHEEAEEPREAGLWLEGLPMPPVALVGLTGLPDGACSRQLGRYAEELARGTLWATEMFDASIKYPHGIIDGQTRHFGSFDQCYGIKTQLPDRDANIGCTEDLYGKYCLVDFKYGRKDEATPYHGRLELDFDPNDSAWAAIEERGDFRRTRRYVLQLGLCVPAACSAEDVQRSLQAPYQNFAERNNLSLDVAVDRRNCQAYPELPHLSLGAIIYCLMLLCIIVLVLASSLSDDGSTSEVGRSFGAELLLCFSAPRNLRLVLEVRHKHRGLDAIHMFRFLATCLVIFGHRGLVYYRNPVVNQRHFEMTFDIPSFIMLYNGPILVDGFFAIGGLLTCYALLDQYDKTKRIDFANAILIRFLRLTPVYAFVLFFNAHVFRHLGSGPLWESLVGVEADNCASAWWAHLLYLNNYMTMDRICIFQSWYLAVDFHCYVFTIFLISEFSKRPRQTGYKILAGVILVSILIPFWITFFYRIQPLLIVYPSITNLSMDSYFCNYYVKTHLRMTAYLVGVVAGAILYDYEKTSYRIPSRLSKVLFVLLYVGMTHAAQALGYPYLNPNSNPSSLITALYASLHRGVYAAGVCSLVLLLTMGDGLDSQYNFFTAGWAQPLGRLTYSAFLCHNIVQAYQAATARSARTFSAHNLIWDLVPDIFWSFTLAFLIVVGIECPFRRLEKLLVRRYVLKSISEKRAQKEVKSEKKQE